MLLIQILSFYLHVNSGIKLQLLRKITIQTLLVLLSETRHYSI
jgi:hypothetical protein